MTEDKPRYTIRLTQDIVYDSLAWHLANHTMPPSLSDLAALLGISKTATLWHVSKLEADGKITRQPGKHRTMRVVEKC